MNKDEQQLYWVWGAMVARCHNANNLHYSNYGGRGISVSSSWRESKNFIKDMSPRPDGATLERIDNSLGYSKENCAWVPRLNNNKNKRTYKNCSTGISGVERRSSGYRVRIRHEGKIVADKHIADFFEACCFRKSLELIYVAPYISLVKV